jgi:hypothetical protein
VDVRAIGADGEAIIGQADEIDRPDPLTATSMIS